MIKFVCNSCGERLSVPDQHAGRKGICPNCHAINRIPLKGMAETQPNNQPLVANPATAAGAQAAVRTPMSIPLEDPQRHQRSSTLPSNAPPMSPASSRPPAIDDYPPQSRPFSLPPESKPIPAPAASPVNPAARFASPTKVIPEPDNEAALRAARRANQNPFALPEGDEPGELVELRKERRLPKQVKMTLLFLGALAIVAALYFGLRFGLHAALQSMNNGE